MLDQTLIKVEGASSMRQAPKNKIAKEAISAWRVHGMIYSAVMAVLFMSLLFMTYKFELTYIYSGISFLVFLLLSLLLINLLPKLRYKRWRYEIYTDEIYIQYGVLIKTQTLIPMARIQYVNTRQGPILKKYNLSSVTITTAATQHEIPALILDEAMILRDHISTLAKVDARDV